MTGTREPVRSLASTVSESGGFRLWMMSGLNSASASRRSRAGRSPSFHQLSNSSSPLPMDSLSVRPR